MMSSTNRNSTMCSLRWPRGTFAFPGSRFPFPVFRSRSVFPVSRSFSVVRRVSCLPIAILPFAVLRLRSAFPNYVQRWWSPGVLRDVKQTFIRMTFEPCAMVVGKILIT